ncbi:polymerase [Globisporangium polare]
MDAAAPPAPARAARDGGAPVKSGDGSQPPTRAPRSRGRGAKGSRPAKNGGDPNGADGSAAAAQPRKVKDSTPREKKQQKKKKKERPAAAATASADAQHPHGDSKPQESVAHNPPKPPSASAADVAPPPPPAAAPSASSEQKSQSERENPKGNPNAEFEPERTKLRSRERAPVGLKKPSQAPADSRSAHTEYTAAVAAAEDLVTPAHFSEAAWFTASGGDLRFAQWLFGRSQGVADLKTLQDAAALKRVHQLYTLEKRVQQELQLRGSETTAAAEDGDGENGEPSNGADEDAGVENESADSTLWTAGAIVEGVRGALRESRYELWKRSQEAQQKNNSNGSRDEPKQKQRSLEKTLVKELVENTTELLLNRATFEDIAVLESWMAFLNQDAKDLGSELEGNPEETETPELTETPSDAPEPATDGAVVKANESESNTNAKPSKREKKRKEKQRRSGKDHEAAACEQLRSCMDFLRECHRMADEAQSPASGGEKGLSSQQLAESPAAAQIVSELNQIYLKQRINEHDEAQRLRLTQDLQQLFRRRVDKWHKCKMVLFGSSLSLYGSISSDLDMCLIMKPSSSSDSSIEQTKKVIGGRELRSMLSGKSSSSSSSAAGNGMSMDMVALQELLFQVRKSVEKTTILYNDLNKAGGGEPSRGQLKQMQQLRFFRAHFKLLQEAIDERVVAIGKDGNGVNDNGEAAAAVAKAAATRIKEIMAKSRRQSDDLFRVKAMLERANCQIRVVISGARIPIIRFQHLPTKFECDMCFENVLATRNTFLLRAYAAFDERARVLGVAIKHWAKARVISDASMGFLSSYSYVLLSVYFLQVVAGVLPNLQDPELLAEANVAPELYNGVNIAFCEDRAAAQRFHEKHRRVAEPAGLKHSLATLLLGFFEFYATKFDFARRMVAVRAPVVPAVEKRVQWGPQKARSWRMSIQDPLEISRDLGCVLQFKGQEKILKEFRRAHELLRDGKSFVDVASESALSSPQPQQTAGAGNEKAKKGKQEKNGNKDANKKPAGASYSLTLWGHSVELSKANIGYLLRSVDASIRLGKIEKAVEPNETNSKLQKWRVELLSGAGDNACPPILQLKSRVDFVSQVQTTMGSGEKVGMTNCVVWLHHHALFPHAPCSKCCSPEHSVQECNNSSPESTSDAHVLRVVEKKTQKSKAARAKGGKTKARSSASANKENLGASAAQATSSEVQ